MAFIETVAVEHADGEVRRMYERAQAEPGYVPNYARLFSWRPEVMSAWGALIAAIRTPMDQRHYELVTLAAAGALRSSYCSLAHGRVLEQHFYSPAQVAAIAADPTRAGLPPAEVAMMAFAERIVRDAAQIDAAQIEELRAHGWDDGAIFDIAAAAAVRCFYSKLLDALGAEPDSVYLDLDAELRDTLTVGRPISTAPLERVPAVQT